MEGSSLTIIDVVSPENLKWRRHAILFKKDGADATLKLRYGYSDAKTLHGFILSYNKPLLRWHSNPKNNMRDGQFMLAGAGVGHDASHALEYKKNAIDENEVRTAYKELAPLLGSLEPGVYLLSIIPHMPVNSRGDFFWGLGNAPEKYVCHNFSDAPYPLLLVPSKPTEHFDDKKLESLLKAREEGRISPGVCYYFDDYHSLLIDGHHSASAAYLKGDALDCVTIMPCQGYRHDGNSVQGLFFGGQEIRMDSADGRFMEEIKKNREKLYFSTGETEDYFAMTSPAWDVNSLPEKLKAASGGFPELFVIESTEFIKDFSDKNIERIIKSENPKDIRLKEILFENLLRTNKAKAYKAAVLISRDLNCQLLWSRAFEFLADFRAPEVEQLFVDYMTADNGERPEITGVIDKYFFDKDKK